MTAARATLAAVRMAAATARHSAATAATPSTTAHSAAHTETDADADADGFGRNALFLLPGSRLLALLRRFGALLLGGRLLDPLPELLLRLRTRTGRTKRCNG